MRLCQKSCRSLIFICVYMKKLILTAIVAVSQFIPLMADSAKEYTYVGEDRIVYYGTRRSETYDLAMKFENGALAGKRITAIRAMVNYPEQEIVDCKVWLSTELLLKKNENNKKVNAPNILSQEATLSEDGWISATLDEPYTLTSAPVYVGYSFTNVNYNSEVKDPIAYSQTRHPEGFYIHTSMTVIKWKSYEEDLKGVLPIYVTVEGEYGSEEVAIGGYATDYPYAQIDQPTVLPFKLYNVGDNSVTSVEYSYDVEGIKGSNRIEFAEPLVSDMEKYHVVELTFPAMTTLGSKTLTVSIDKVNDKANASTVASITLPFEVKELVPVHRVVLEEGTGVWCSACPRGAVAMKELTRLYSRNFIGLAYHAGNDPMMVMDEFPVDFPHFPSAYLNRGDLIDPYYGADKSQNDDFAIEPLVVSAFEVPAIAAIDVSSQWVDEERTAIDAKAVVAFTSAINDADYRVSFILVANGLSGEGPLWSQVNGLAKHEIDNLHPLLRPLAERGNPIEGFVYDDVVIISKDPFGIAGSVPSSLAAFEWCETSYQFQLSDAVGKFGDNLVQDKEQLEVVALLLDARTGAIVNAAKAHVGKRSAVTNVNTSASVVATTYYDLQGRIVVAPERGVYIVLEELSDGSRRATKRFL